MATLPERFGRALRRLRQGAGVSQEDLAASANLHRNTVGLIERGGRVPSLLVIDALARALGTTMSSLLAEVEAEPDEDG